MWQMPDIIYVYGESSGRFPLCGLNEAYELVREIFALKDS